MLEDSLLTDLRRRMDGAIEVLRKEFGGLRTGRASASLLEPVTVTAYGGTMPINQLANVSVPEPRMITVQVWDRAMVKAVDKAIREAGLGLNPQTEGQVIRVPIPDLNEERRRELTRVSAKYAEQARVSVRNVRRDGIEVLRRREKGAEISQDEQRKLQHEIQHVTDELIATHTALLERLVELGHQIGSATERFGSGLAPAASEPVELFDAEALEHEEQPDGDADASDAGSPDSDADEGSDAGAETAILATAGPSPEA